MKRRGLDGSPAARGALKGLAGVALWLWQSSEQQHGNRLPAGSVRQRHGGHAQPPFHLLWFLPEILGCLFPHFLPPPPGSNLSAALSLPQPTLPKTVCSDLLAFPRVSGLGASLSLALVTSLLSQRNPGLLCPHHRILQGSPLADFNPFIPGWF